MRKDIAAVDREDAVNSQLGRTVEIKRIHKISRTVCFKRQTGEMLRPRLCVDSHRSARINRRIRVGQDDSIDCAIRTGRTADRHLRVTEYKIAVNVLRSAREIEYTAARRNREFRTHGSVEGSNQSPITRSDEFGIAAGRKFNTGTAERIRRVLHALYADVTTIFDLQKGELITVVGELNPRIVARIFTLRNDDRTTTHEVVKGNVIPRGSDSVENQTVPLFLHGDGGTANSFRIVEFEGNARSGQNDFTGHIAVHSTNKRFTTGERNDAALHREAVFLRDVHGAESLLRRTKIDLTSTLADNEVGSVPKSLVLSKRQDSVMDRRRPGISILILRIFVADRDVTRFKDGIAGTGNQSSNRPALSGFAGGVNREALGCINELNHTQSPLSGQSAFIRNKRSVRIMEIRPVDFVLGNRLNDVHPVAVRGVEHQIVSANRARISVDKDDGRTGIEYRSAGAFVKLAEIDANRRRIVGRRRIRKLTGCNVTRTVGVHRSEVDNAAAERQAGQRTIGRVGGVVHNDDRTSIRYETSLRHGSTVFREVEGTFNKLQRARKGVRRLIVSKTEEIGTVA